MQSRRPASNKDALSKAKQALGAAFSHARKVEAKTGGGKKKQKAVAAAYLKRKKMPAMSKAMPNTLGAYQSAIMQQSAPGHLSDDDKYAMAQYQSMFAQNWANIARIKQEQLARQLSQGRP